MMELVSKYRVDDDWINCEMAYLKKRMKFDDSDAVLTTETSVPILFAMLEEIKERRESDTSGGVTMERVSNEWLDEAIPKYSIIDSKSKGANVYVALCELRERRQNEIKAQQEIEKLKNEYLEKIDVLVKSFVEGHTDHSATEKDGAWATQEREKAILPLPVKQVDGVSVETGTVKQWFQKINEELDELKDAILEWNRIAGNIGCLDLGGCKNIAGEAADTITAITSMLEAMGIDEQQRQAAQKLVNEHNRQRGRI